VQQNSTIDTQFGVIPIYQYSNSISGSAVIMEIRQLKYFNALATELNFTRAARALKVSQPPLSLQIAQLEEELNARLFDRTSRSVALTAAGRALLPHAQAILARVEEARGHITRIANGLEGRVRVGMAAAHFLGPFPRFLAEFRKQRPKVEMVLTEMTQADHHTGLGDHRLDLVLARHVLAQAQTSSALLWRDPVVAALPPGHRLGRRARVDLADLHGEDFVFVQRGSSPFARRLHEACVEHGFEPRIVHEVADFPAALSLAAAGIGVTLAPASMALMRQDALTICTLVQSHISIDPAQLEAGITSPSADAKLNGDVYAMWRTDDDSAALAELRKSLLTWAHEHVLDA
jgi:LysR family transcriptional regulator, benzoate and cis,cis-muconate-responsive activator of ben and cat genes